MKDTWLPIALDITSRFEGAGWDTVTGNFDGMGVSAGALQWNFGTGSLQVLILKYVQKIGSIQESLFPKRIDELGLATTDQAVQYAKDHMLDERGRLLPEWEIAWKSFLKLRGCVEVQLEMAKSIGNWACFEMEKWELTSLKAFCFFFDVRTQNGSMKGIKRQPPSLDAYHEILELSPLDMQKEWESVIPDDETCVLLLAAYQRSMKSNPKWQEDVFRRKATIAMGRGVVHRIKYNFEPIFLQDQGIITDIKGLY